jgi:hypothetical protein
MSTVESRRRTARRAVLLIAALAATLISVPRTATGAVEYTQWDLAGDYGDYIIGPNSHSYGAADDITVTGGTGGIQAEVSTAENWWTLDVAPADGDVLQAGRTYTGATRAPFAEPHEPGLQLTGTGRGCNELTGTFTINEIVADGLGNVLALNLTFEQHCEGAGPAAYGSLAWHSTMPPAALPPTAPGPPSVALRVTPRKVAYGKTIELRAQLKTYSDDRTLSVYEKVGSLTRTLVTTADADAGGALTLRLPVRGNTVYTAVYEDSGSDLVATATAKVRAVARLDTDVARSSGKQGRYHLIANGKRTYFLARVLPESPKACLGFRAQFLVGGRWGYDGVVGCVRLSKKSVAGVFFDWDQRLAGIPIRIRAEWKGDRSSLRKRSGWSYLRMVNGRVAAPRTDTHDVGGAVAVPLPGL